MSEVKTEKLSPRVTSLQLGDSGDTFTVPSGATLDVDGTIDVTGATVSGLTTGKVLQVVQTVKTNTFTTAASGHTTWTDITGFSLSITPSSTSSKILLMGDVQGSGSSYSYVCAFRFNRDGTGIGLGDAMTGFDPATAGHIRAVQDNNSSFRVPMIYMDSPSSTSAITYKIQGQVEMGGFYINRTADMKVSFFSTTSISSITAMEIGA